MNLKELRVSKGLSQKDASFFLSIPLRTYKRLENEPNYSKNSKYSYALNKLKDYKKEVANNKSYKITVVGAGYVGLSLAVLFSTTNRVNIVDINEDKINKINNREPIFVDKDIEYYLKNKKLDLEAHNIDLDIYKNSDYVIISTPTDYKEETKSYDMSNVINTIRDVRSVNKDCLIIIKSTCYIGFTKSLNDPNIIFSPEFLREGNALKDNLYPTRIIIGGDKNNKKIKEFANLLTRNALNSPLTLYMSSSEAEAVKLFSNAYLALRVSYFNEMDSLAASYDLDSKLITQGVSLDPRIGDYYNNPSFGYGGYCLPKDTNALISQMKDVSNNDLITAISNSNRSRKEFIVKDILKLIKPNSTVGVFSLLSKSSGDNTRYSAIKDVIKGLENKGIKILIYDKNKMSLEDFKKKSDLIITNRYDSSLDDVKEKVYTRDLFKRD